MSDSPHTPGSAEAASTPRPELGIGTHSTPRISSASSDASDAGAQLTNNHNEVENAGEYLPQGGKNYFARTADRDAEPATRRSNDASEERDDETGSTTTNLTELSTTAQAGSVAHSELASPIAFDEDGRSDDFNEKSAHTADYGEDGKPDASPFIYEDRETARKAEPPSLNLAARTHPLADGEAQHGGVPLRESVQAKMDEDREAGVLSPAYDGAGPSGEFQAREEDNYSSDEGQDTHKEKAKGLVTRLKGEAKVLSGKIRRDPQKVEEGKIMKGEM